MERDFSFTPALVPTLVSQGTQSATGKLAKCACLVAEWSPPGKKTEIQNRT